MKYFISWSGDLSRKVAMHLGSWLQDVLQGTKAWISEGDIDKGSIWFDEIRKELSDTSVGILCLTRDNKDAPWILFEAGALCKGLPKNRVCPFLIDLVGTDLKPPLGQFNGTHPTKDDVLKLVETINSQRGDQKLPDAQLTKTFDRWWPDFETGFKKILTSHKPQGNAQERSTDDMIKEVLELTRSIQRLQQQAAYAPQLGQVHSASIKAALAAAAPWAHYIAPHHGAADFYPPPSGNEILQMLDEVRAERANKEKRDTK